MIWQTNKQILNSLNAEQRVGSHPRSIPDAVQDVSVGVNPQHDVLHGGVMDEGALRMDEEDVGDPDLLHQPGIKRPAPVGLGWKRQTLVLPVVTQVQSHGEVLKDAHKICIHLLYSSATQNRKHLTATANIFYSPEF